MISMNVEYTDGELDIDDFLAGFRQDLDEAFDRGAAKISGFEEVAAKVSAIMRASVYEVLDGIVPPTLREFVKSGAEVTLVPLTPDDLGEEPASDFSVEVYPGRECGLLGAYTIPLRRLLTGIVLVNDEGRDLAAVLRSIADKLDPA